MALRKRPIVAGMAALLFSGWVSALGLGEIKLNSALNEPLDAEIPLINLGELERNEIIASLATAQQFQKAGVSRELILSSLVFRLDLDAPGGPVLRVNSRKPIREPYLDFLVDVQWPSGRLLREYTLLLDLPVYARSEETRRRLDSRTAGASRDAAASPAPRSRTRSTESRQTASSVGRVDGVVASGEEYQVRDGNTLWSIAAALPTNVSVHKKMAAIQQLNPDAFIDGNIDMLKRGAVLRLPDMQQIRSAEGAPASASTVASYRRGAESAPQLSGSRRVQASAGGESKDGGGRLRLSTTDSGDGEGGALGAGGDGSAALRSELDTMGEELDRTRRENENLKERLSSLEEQIATMQRLFELGDEDLRAAQLAAMTDSMSDEEMEEAAKVLAEADLIEEEDFEASPALALFPSANEGSKSRSASSGPSGGNQGPGNGEGQKTGSGQASPTASGPAGSGDGQRATAGTGSETGESADPASGSSPTETAAGDLAQPDETAQTGADSVEQTSGETASSSPDAESASPGSGQAGSMSMQTEKKEGWFETVSSYLLYLIGALAIAGVGAFLFLRRRRENSDYGEMPARRQTPPPAPRPPEPEIAGETGSRIGSVDDIDLREEDDLFEQPEAQEGSAFEEPVYAGPRQQDASPDAEPDIATPEPVAERSGETDSSQAADELELDLSEFELDDPAAAEQTPRSGGESGDQNSGELNLDEEFDLLGDVDEGDTQLELAQAYIEMGDHSGAREILQEVEENGNDSQQSKARDLMEQIS